MYTIIPTAIFLDSFSPGTGDISFICLVYSSGDVDGSGYNFESGSYGYNSPDTGNDIRCIFWVNTSGLVNPYEHYVYSSYGRLSVRLYYRDDYHTYQMNSDWLRHQRRHCLGRFLRPALRTSSITAMIMHGVSILMALSASTTITISIIPTVQHAFYYRMTSLSGL